MNMLKYKYVSYKEWNALYSFQAHQIELIVKEVNEFTPNFFPQ